MNETELQSFIKETVDSIIEKKLDNILAFFRENCSSGPSGFESWSEFEYRLREHLKAAVGKTAGNDKQIPVK